MNTTTASGLLPRPVAALAGAGLAVVTGVAIWLLPGPAPTAPARAVPFPTPSVTTRATVLGGPRPAEGVAGYVPFVAAVGGRGPTVPASTRRIGPRRFAVGYLTAGRDGCTPRWAGTHALSDPAVSGRLARLRRTGGQAVPVFGGPAGREPAATCADPSRLRAAYRAALQALETDRIEFESGPGGDGAGTLRRAAALTALQAEARGRGRPLSVTFTVRADASGISRRDRRMLRATWRAGVEIGTVNLLVAFRPGAPGGTERAFAAVRSARRQLAQALGAAPTGLALTPMPARPGDLTPADAARLAAFAVRQGLAWLSIRGAAPTSRAARLLGSAWREPAAP